MSGKNKGFASILTADDGDEASESAIPMPKILSERANSLSRLATNEIVKDKTEWVDPSRCRPWKYADRNIELLNQHNCSDLIESFKVAGRQKIPAVVRRITDDPNYDFEIIYGLRRHWTVTWLRNNHYPDFKFLVTIQKLTDEEALYLSDIENRSRKDLSDLERARKYRVWLHEFYGGHQAAMAERLLMSKSWLNRYIALAEMPSEVIAAFGDPHAIRVDHAKSIAPLLNKPSARESVLAEAAQVTKEQAAALANGDRLLAPTKVVLRLVNAGKVRKIRKNIKEQVIVSSTGLPMLKSKLGKTGEMNLTIMPKSGATRQEVIEAITKILGDQSLSNHFV